MTKFWITPTMLRAHWRRNTKLGIVTCFKKKKDLFIDSFFGCAGLWCLLWVLLSCGKRRATLWARCAGLSLKWFLCSGAAWGCKLQKPRCVGPGVAAHQLQGAGSVAVAHGLSCPEAPGIFPNQESNQCPQRSQEVSLPLSCQGYPATLNNCLFFQSRAEHDLEIGAFFLKLVYESKDAWKITGHCRRRQG